MHVIDVSTRCTSLTIQFSTGLCSTGFNSFIFYIMGLWTRSICESFVWQIFQNDTQLCSSLSASGLLDWYSAITFRLKVIWKTTVCFMLLNQTSNRSVVNICYRTTIRHPANIHTQQYNETYVTCFCVNDNIRTNESMRSALHNVEYI